MRKLFPDNATEVLKLKTKDGALYMDVVWQGKIVGCRVREGDGTFLSEYQVDSRSRRHGIEREWIEGRLVCEARWRCGREHGIIRQWDRNGKLLGTYRMRDGTGVDLSRDDDGFLAEEYHMRKGLRHGIERWWNGDDKTVYLEAHWHNGCIHGIEREWDEKGKLKKGYPRFYIKGKHVSKSEYLKQSLRSRTLPRFDEAENSPQRELPKEYRKKKRQGSR